MLAKNIKKMGIGLVFTFVFSIIGFNGFPIINEKIDPEVNIPGQDATGPRSNDIYVNPTPVPFTPPQTTGPSGAFTFTEGSFDTIGSISADDGDYTEIEATYNTGTYRYVEIRPNADISSNWSHTGFIYDDINNDDGSNYAWANSIGDNFEVELDDNANLAMDEVCTGIDVYVTGYVSGPTNCIAYLEVELNGTGAPPGGAYPLIWQTSWMSASDFWVTSVNLSDSKIDDLTLNCSWVSGDATTVYLDEIYLRLYVTKKSYEINN